MLTLAIDSVDVASLMPLETPILKVSRPVAACSRCRNAKIKCDGKLPACTSCEKNGRASECTSTNDQFARGKERSYVSTLETRIDKLQAKLEETRARKPSVISLPDDDQTAIPSRRSSCQVPEPTTTPPTISKAMRRKEVHAIDDLVSDFGFLSVNATARDFYGFTSAMSYARLILSACSKDPLPEGMAKPLPPRHSASTLIQHYLNNVFSLLPVFDEASFWASVDNVYSRESYQVNPLDHFMVRIVLAISSASMSEQRGDPHYLEAIGHVCGALEHAEDVLHPGSIPSVQALVLLTEFAMLDPHHFDSWSLIGAASRAMVDLGLHQDPPKGTHMPKAKLLLRRRVFHCIYSLDRSTSIVQTRAFSFSDDSTKVKVPFGKGQSASSSSPMPAARSPPAEQAWLVSHETNCALIKLRKLQSVWYADLFQSGRTPWDEPYPYLWDTCDAMQRWFDALPTAISPHTRAFFELDLLYSYIYVLSPSPRVPVIDPYAQKLIFEYCIRYADLILQLIGDVSYTSPLTFYDAMRVYMTGRQFVDVLNQNTQQLLRGDTPPLPHVKLTTAPPPVMPIAAPPNGDLPERYNTLRSIKCIKNITECLLRFGMRWGYMSWNQRYQSETSGTLDELHLRLRDLDNLSGVRQPSLWPGQGSGSTMSSSELGLHNSLQLQSPFMDISFPRTQTLQSSPPFSPSHIAPIPLQHQNVSASGAQQLALPTLPTHPQQAQHPQILQPMFSFNGQMVSQPDPVFATQPGYGQPDHQFAAWPGYTVQAQRSVPSDQDTAVPPNSNVPMT